MIPPSEVLRSDLEASSLTTLVFFSSLTTSNTSSCAILTLSSKTPLRSNVAAMYGVLDQRRIDARG